MELRKDFHRPAAGCEKDEKEQEGLQHDVVSVVIVQSCIH
jgi:hypothetical protein